ncbi:MULTISPECIES: enoyl-CoA hydratase/isomerase family protein [Ramlibacter]|uniref:Enoyl-CoA hydratase/isomerase family protein n=1 Tax=Ramlibacter aquaticus TaxID=2780094 RepID=A0ABR9SCL6_9BURK|nr:MULTISPECIES: enoyl-CoA hydratase/isomerase family protein [Ramlibacter]MBE7940040.1 enoyl-CoA hydratase/isomerase family protein [Ramlibacter aquaticus]
MAGTVRLSIEGPLARVTLAHPGKLNAMSRSMWRELRAHFQFLQTAPGLRCVLVAGEGAAFCAGGDIAEYPAFRFDEASLAAFHEEDVWGGLSAMLACELPLVACIEGACMGAGVEIASCCDLRYAEAGARFGAPIARLGFPMAPREAALVAQAVGALTAREFLLDAAVLDAQEMKSRGFLNRVLPAQELHAAAESTVRRIASLAPQAARLNKRTLGALARAVPAAILEGAYSYARTAEHREGVMAFIEKRKPDFQQP